MKFCLRYPHGDRVCPSTRHLGFTSLDALLVSQPSAFTYKSRLQLGLKLASSVLQLHSSEWLPRSWNAHDIVFFTTPDTGEVNISNPIVRKPKTCDLNRATGSPSPQVNYDPTLVSLGMVLIELHYGRRLEACGQSVESQIRQGRLSALGDYDCYDESARFAQAYQLVEELYEDAGFAYAEAVRRCIRGIDHHESSLDKDGYKEKAYSDIMCPLKTSWERFAIGR